MKKKIILVVSTDATRALAKVSEIYAQDPDGRRIVRTRTELQVALASGHTAIMNTLPAVLQIRYDNLRVTHPEAALEVVNLDA